MKIANKFKSDYLNYKVIYFSLLLFGVFCLITLLVSQGLTRQSDLSVIILLQSIIPTNLDTLLSLFSLLGSFEITSLILLILLLTHKNVKTRILLITLFIIGHLIELAGKTLVIYPNPPSIFFRYNLKLFFPSVYVQTGHSFPSGHSMRSVFLIMLLIYWIFNSVKLTYRWKILGTFFLILFLMVMLISRISLGEHWFSDVLAGTFLGASLSIFSLVIRKNPRSFPTSG